MTTLIKSMIIRANVPEYLPGTGVDTEVIVEDEGGGPFFTLKQEGLQDWLERGYAPQIRVDFAEIEELYETLQTIRAQWQLAGADK